MHSLFFKDNSEFNTGNTEIKLGVGEQGKKQYAIPLSLEGFWHTCAVWSNAIWAVVPLQSHSRLCSSPFPTLRHGSGISDLLAHEEAWPLVCSRAAGKLSGGALQHTQHTTIKHPYFFPHWITIFSSGGSPLWVPMRRWGMFGVRLEMFDPPAVQKRCRLSSPASSDIVRFHLCQWWRLIEHQEGEGTFHKTAGGKGLPIIFLLMTFRMHRFLLAVPLVLCP